MGRVQFFGVEELRQRFEALQARLPSLWRDLSDFPEKPRTVVAIPSLSLDLAGLVLTQNLLHYEERGFYQFNHLRQPHCRLVLVTSNPIPEGLLAYHLHLLRGVPYSHAYARVKLLNAFDSSTKPLTQKILERPGLLARLKRSIEDPARAYISCYNITRLEMELAVKLGIPLMGPHPDHREFGTKSSGRRLFRRIGIRQPEGIEGLSGVRELAQALVELATNNPEYDRLVIKQNLSLSGLGNAIYPLQALRESDKRGPAAVNFVVDSLPELVRLPAHLSWQAYLERFSRLGGVVEEFIEGCSCSVTVRISPLREIELVATHDERTEGQDGQTYVGCRFPADPSLHPELHKFGLAVGEELAKQDFVGRFDADFIADSQNKLWALDINLRKGNTTLPIRTLQLMAGGRYVPEQGVFAADCGEPRFYYSSDQLSLGGCRGMLPQDVIDIATYQGLHYSSSDHVGTVFHMLGGLSESGKVGVTCIERSQEKAEELSRRTREELKTHCGLYEWIV